MANERFGEHESVDEEPVRLEEELGGELVRRVDPAADVSPFVVEPPHSRRSCHADRELLRHHFPAE